MAARLLPLCDPDPFRSPFLPKKVWMPRTLPNKRLHLISTSVGFPDDPTWATAFFHFTGLLPQWLSSIKGEVGLDEPNLVSAYLENLRRLISIFVSATC